MRFTGHAASLAAIKMHIVFYWESMKGSHLVNQGVDGRIILNPGLEKIYEDVLDKYSFWEISLMVAGELADWYLAYRVENSFI